MSAASQRPIALPGNSKILLWSQRVPAYVKCGCLATEMECAAIFSVGLVRKARCGAVLTALWNDGRVKAGLPDVPTQDSTNAINCAVEAFRILIEEDKNN